MSKLRNLFLLAILIGAFTVFGSVPVSAQEPEPEPDAEQQAEEAQPESNLTTPEMVLDFLLPGEQEDVSVGQEARASIYLVDPAGNPIAGAEILFTLEAEFMNVVSALELGVDVTDGAGLAEVHWDPRSEGENLVSARFAGNDVFGPLMVQDTLQVNTGPEQYTEAEPLRIPAADIWMVVFILGATWSMYLLTLVFGWKIARAGGSS